MPVETKLQILENVANRYGPHQCPYAARLRDVVQHEYFPLHRLTYYSRELMRLHAPGTCPPTHVVDETGNRSCTLEWSEWVKDTQV